MDAKIKVKEYNIGTEAQPKMAKIGDYWSEHNTTRIVNLLNEYQDVFTREYKYLKGLFDEMGEMKIRIFPEAKPVKNRPYKLAYKYKDIAKTEIDNMLTAGIIYLVDQLEWESPMVAQPKNHDPTKLGVCVYYRWLNRATMTNPFPTPFSNEIINEVIGHECYSFKHGFLGYNQVPIAKEDQHKTTFACGFGSFSYRKMPFGLKNAPIVFSRIVVKAFKEYLYKSMGVYFNDWTIYSMLKYHVKWLRLILKRCRQIQLSLNITKCIFDTPIGILLGHFICKEGIKVDLEKIKVIPNQKPLINPKQIKIFLGHTEYITENLLGTILISLILWRIY